MVKKPWQYLSRFHRIPERDGPTDKPNCYIYTYMWFICCSWWLYVQRSDARLWHLWEGRVQRSERRTGPKRSLHTGNRQGVLLHGRPVQFSSSNLSWSYGAHLHCGQSPCTGRWSFPQPVMMNTASSCFACFAMCYCCRTDNRQISLSATFRLKELLIGTHRNYSLVSSSFQLHTGLICSLRNDAVTVGNGVQELT